MTETRTTRLQLPQWSSGTSDSPSREDFNEAFANLEKWAGRWESGPLVDRRGPGVPDSFYVDETGAIYRDTGTVWQPIGAPKNALTITKESGTDPALKIVIPENLTADAIQTLHNGNKSRFRVTARGDVIGSSTRLYQSDTLPPADNLPHTVGIAAKSGSASGLTVYGAAGQAANLVETRTKEGADLTQLTSSGDVYSVGRGAFGTLTPGDAQLFVGGVQESRPVLALRGSNPLLGNGPIFAAQNRDGTLSLLKLDATGRLAIGDRGNAALNPSDLFAINTNYANTNNGATSIPRGRAVFRNTSNGNGVAGLDIRQEPGDGPNTSSLGVFAGQAANDLEAPERVRFGITPDKTGARFTTPDAQWTPVVVRAAAGQTANLLSVQRADGTVIASFDNEGDLLAKTVSTNSTDTNTFGGDIIGGKRTQGQTLRAIQSDGSVGVGVLSQIKKAHASGYHFLAQDEEGSSKARINRDGTLEIGMDQTAVSAGAVLLTMRGQQYRQNGRKLQSWDADAGRWGSFESAFASEYYSTTVQNVTNNWVPIKWGGETNDTENAFDNTPGTSGVKVPFTGWYDVRALSHVNMNFTGSGSATFRVNGALEMKYRRDFPRALGFDVCTLSLNDLVYLNKNDILEMAVQIDSWFFTVQTLNSGDYRSRMSIRFTGNA